MIAATLCFSIVAASMALELRRHRLEQRARSARIRRRINRYTARSGR